MSVGDGQSVAPCCWQCGVPPSGVLNVQAFNDLGPVWIPTGWPGAGVDHQHALTPPTPGELTTAGDRIVARILDSWNS